MKHYLSRSIDGLIPIAIKYCIFDEQTIVVSNGNEKIVSLQWVDHHASPDVYPVENVILSARSF